MDIGPCGGGVAANAAHGGERICTQCAESGAQTHVRGVTAFELDANVDSVAGGVRHPGGGLLDLAGEVGAPARERFQGLEIAGLERLELCDDEAGVAGVRVGEGAGCAHASSSPSVDATGALFAALAHEACSEATSVVSLSRRASSGLRPIALISLMNQA